MRKASIILSSVLLTAVALVLLCWSDNPRASVAFVGCTNDPTGTRLATFAFTNLGHSTVILEAGYWVQSLDASGQDVSDLYHNVLKSGWDSKVLPGQSATLLAVAPTNQPTWRISLGVRHPEIFPQKVVRAILTWAKIPITETWLVCESEWINE